MKIYRVQFTRLRCLQDPFLIFSGTSIQSISVEPFYPTETREDRRSVASCRTLTAIHRHAIVQCDFAYGPSNQNGGLVTI